MKIIDISIPISSETPVWEGEKGISISQTMKIDGKSVFNVSRIEMGVHAGTHVDAPYHVVKDGDKVDQIPLDALIGEVHVVKVPDHISVIDEDYLKDLPIIHSIERVLFKTKNSEFWINDKYTFNRDFLALNSQGAKYLSNTNLRLIGIDYFSISCMSDLVKPHKILLQKGIYILENIDLRHVQPGRYDIFCLPMKITGVEGAPARVVLLERKN
jgi:arylformamidase